MQPASLNATRQLQRLQSFILNSEYITTIRVRMDIPSFFAHKHAESSSNTPTSLAMHTSHSFISWRVALNRVGVGFNGFV